jgi:hypothetical protein
MEKNREGMRERRKAQTSVSFSPPLPVNLSQGV